MNEDRYREAERGLWESVGVTPTEQRVRLVRTGVTVRIQEVGRGPAAVFVHGVSVAGSSWAPLVARLDGFRCVVLDRPGCGLSDPLATGFDDVEAFDAFADVMVVDLLDALGLESAHIVATSFGGYFALRAAASHPDRISRMVLFGWTLGAPTVRIPLVMRLVAVPGLGPLLAAVPPTKRAVRAMLRQIGLRQALESGRVAPELLDWFLAVLRDTDSMQNELSTLPRLLSLRRGMDDRVLLPVSVLAGIQTPVFFLWGEEDVVAGPAIAQQFVEHLPNAELELLPGAGHAVWLDDPGHAAMSTHRFLGR